MHFQQTNTWESYNSDKSLEEWSVGQTDLSLRVTGLAEWGSSQVYRMKPDDNLKIYVRVIYRLFVATFLERISISKSLIPLLDRLLLLRNPRLAQQQVAL